MVNPISSLNKRLMIGVGLDEFVYLLIYLFIYANIKQFGFKIIMSTECNDKNKKLFFELVLRLILQSVLQNLVYKANPQ